MVSYALFYVIGKTYGLRVSPQEENAGLGHLLCRTHLGVSVPALEAGPTCVAASMMPGGGVAEQRSA
ncbi:hypothetical protein DSM104299_05451 [Baekduia alba]|nr:hypothetical protein DSM104299_05451 [Baekduia alba]